MCVQVFYPYSQFSFSCKSKVGISFIIMPKLLYRIKFLAGLSAPNTGQKLARNQRACILLWASICTIDT